MYFLKVIGCHITLKVLVFFVDSTLCFNVQFAFTKKIYI